MATTDLLSAEEARQALQRGVQDADKAALLTATVSAISERLAEAAGPIVCGTITGELHDGGGTAIWLAKYPVYSVTTVVEYDYTTAGTLTAETNASKPSSGYRVNLENGKVTRRSDNATASFPAGVDNVYVTYIAGRFTATSTVEEKFKEAARVVLKNVWRMWENSVATVDGFESPMAHIPSFLTPNVAKSLLGSDWHEGSGVGE